jgi:hypothetical protein
MLAQWIAAQNDLLDLEKNVETDVLVQKLGSLSAKSCQREGFSVLNLRVQGVRTAMFGRCCVTVEKMDRSPIPVSFKVGDEVGLYNPQLSSSKAENNSVVEGLISKITEKVIDIVVNDFEEQHFEAPLRLDIRPNNKTYEKMKAALSTLVDSSHPLVNVLFAQAALPPYSHRFSAEKETLCNPDLNDSQIDAIRCGLSAPYIALIHGPV